MAQQLMQADRKKSLLDPRTKLILLIIISVFVLGGTGGESMRIFNIVLSVLPFVLLLISGNIKTCISGIAALAVGLAMQNFLIPVLSGVPAYLIIAISGIVTGFIPSIMMGKYVVSTTTVSEFIASMEKMHITEKITIPVSVMFRFFPTVQEEFSSINSAMRMRDIRFSGKKKGQVIEYRIIPMIMCSVKIGEELSASALTRGLGMPVKRTNICKIGFGFADFVIFMLCLATVIFWIMTLLGVIK